MGDWKKHAGYNCYPNRGGDTVQDEPDSKKKTLFECMDLCKVTEGCQAIVVPRKAENSMGDCFTRKLVYLDLCAQDTDYDLYVNADAPTSPPTPVPTPVPPPPNFCADAACCKAKARNAEDGEICDDFYDTQTGIAFTMIAQQTWAGSCFAINGMDCAVFYELPPNYVTKDQEAVSVSHFQKGAAPYGGYGNSFGLALRIGESSNFWKYFEQCPDGGLAAQCHDGFKCGDRRVATQDYAAFKRRKNEIVAQTGTGDCWLPHVNSYNEFDTNGLSSSALAGAFHVAEMGNAPPSDQVCTKLKKSNPKRNRPWPVYGYQYGVGQAVSSLTLDYYLDCDAFSPERCLCDRVTRGGRLADARKVVHYPLLAQHLFGRCLA